MKQRIVDFCDGVCGLISFAGAALARLAGRSGRNDRHWR